MIDYFLPEEVISPQDCVTNVQPLFDGGAVQGAYSIAALEWQRNKCFGIRWNITERELDNPDKVSGKVKCVGEPNSRGYPTWFILPDHFLRALLSIGTIQTRVSEYLDEQ